MNLEILRIYDKHLSKQYSISSHINLLQFKNITKIYKQLYSVIHSDINFIDLLNYVKVTTIKKIL